MYDNGISCDSRYFEIDDEFKLISINGHKIAITIGHDLWNEQRMNDTDNEYSDNTSLLDVYTDQNPDFVVNIAAMPYAYSQNTENLNTISNNAKLYNTPIFYINQVGANCELVYDGNSAAFNQNGEIVCKCKSFDEDLKVFDTKDFDSKGEKIAQNDKIEEIFNAITLALRDYFEKMNFKKAVLGLSGGIDSAVVLAMAVNALGKENVHSILMPTSYSTSHSVDDSLEMLKRTGSSYDIIAIEDLRKAFEQTMSPVFSGTKPGLAEENIQARLRGSILMAYSNKFGNIVLNTSNKSEEAVGYSTLYGDMNGAFSILGDVYKTDVYRLAKYINEHCGNIIPQNIIDKAPSAELRPDQKDQDSLPPYDVLDSILDCYMAKKMSRDELVAEGFDSETVDFILKLVKRVEYKRYQGPPILRLSTTNFGHYQRIPLVAKY
ncbi:MAG: NAD+ synthase, partial [Bacteroidales bacterium]|nr:NAD+ synthase [Bacteroidales bacterium]